MDISPDEIISWIRSIYPEFREKEWHHDQVLHPAKIQNVRFFGQGEPYQIEISPNEIVGINYFGSYNCIAFNPNNKISWLDLLYMLKRLHKVIQLQKSKEQLIQHINNEYLEPKTVVKYGNLYYTIQGQHRLCLAKFLDLDKIKVTVYPMVVKHE